MACRILELDNGHVSLEFETVDIAAVEAAIKAGYVVSQKELQITCTTYIFAGCRFLFYSDFDLPCLISDSTEGDQVLMTLHAEITKKTGDRENT